jgi:hypothetical protein
VIRTLVAACCGLTLLCTTVAAQEKPVVELKLIAKKETYPWPYGLGPKELEQSLKELIQQRKQMEAVEFPTPPAVDLVLEIKNTGSERTTVYIDGDVNVLTLQLKGPGVVTADPGLAFTADLRPSKPTELAPGKSVEIPIKYLADGFRRGGRYIYPTAPGEYTIAATYQLATAEGAKGPVLKSGEVKLKIEEKK